MNAKVVPGVPTAMSHAPTSPMPPARTCPSSRAITGLGSSTIVRSRVTSRAVVRCGPSGSLASRRSLPEQNTVPVWVSTIARTPSSAAAAPSADSSAATRAAESALRFAGESRVIVAIICSTEYRTGGSAGSVVAAGPLIEG